MLTVSPGDLSLMTWMESHCLCPGARPCICAGCFLCLAVARGELSSRHPALNKLIILWSGMVLGVAREGDRAWWLCVKGNLKQKLDVGTHVM